MTYSSNYDVRLPIGEAEKPMSASEVEIMFIGKDLPPDLAKKVSEVIGEKNRGDEADGPYGMVTVEEWMKVANLLNEYVIEE